MMQLLLIATTTALYVVVLEGMRRRVNVNRQRWGLLWWLGLALFIPFEFLPSVLTASDVVLPTAVILMSVLIGWLLLGIQQVLPSASSRDASHE